ncbi:MAG: hypothetical protein L3J66_11925 [Bacteroidales bacterium]|nr:hypothetical protein [Bacteroidales bacterium]
MIIIGHRGAAGYEPENTLLSFQKAIDLNVDMIEFDVRLCKSGEVVIFHDDSLERTTNGVGLVSETSLTELQKLDAGKGQKIPSLSEAFETIGSKVKMNVELKGKSTAEPVSQIVRQFTDSGKINPEDLLISSFMMEELFIISKHFPTIKTAPLFRKLPKDFALTASGLKAFSINAGLAFLTKNDVAKVHASGYRLFVYTVNKPDDKERMKTWGVDGIFTDFP